MKQLKRKTPNNKHLPSELLPKRSRLEKHEFRTARANITFGVLNFQLKERNMVGQEDQL